MEDKYSFKEFLTKETYIGIDSETEEEIMQEWHDASKYEYEYEYGFISKL